MTSVLLIALSTGQLSQIPSVGIKSNNVVTGKFMRRKHNGEK